MIKAMADKDRPGGVQPQIQEQHLFSSDASPEQPPAPYSIYNHKEKWILVGIVGVAGLFSPLPANIYFPAIPTLTTVFNRSTEDLNLTVTIYLAMQGCSPMLWGPLSDRYGRRPLFLLCLLILIGSSLGLALCPTSAFWLLLLLRAVQAGGCASMIALGAGTVGDIASMDERGGFFGMFNLGPMLAPCIGPAIGGALSENLGWRSIFWFLVLFSAGCFAMILLFLPETMRATVGNGSIRPPSFIHIPLLPVVGRSYKDQDANSSLSAPAESKIGAGVSKGKSRKSTNPFRLLLYPDIALTLAYTGIIYAVNYTIMSTISSSFATTYPFLSETLIGICYLSTGMGMLIGSTVNGKLLDFDYARIKKNHSAQNSDRLAGEYDPDFPIEFARLRMVPWLVLIFVGCVIGWGWCISLRSHIAVPLVLQVIRKFPSSPGVIYH
jgi:multidrug resistance protein